MYILFHWKLDGGYTGIKIPPRVGRFPLRCLQRLRRHEHLRALLLFWLVTCQSCLNATLRSGLKKIDEIVMKIKHSIKNYNVHYNDLRLDDWANAICLKSLQYRVSQAQWNIFHPSEVLAWHHRHCDKIFKNISFICVSTADILNAHFSLK